MSILDVVPAHKFDEAAVVRARAAGWPAVKPSIDELLVWVQDKNWPIYQDMTAFLATIGDPSHLTYRRSWTVRMTSGKRT